MSDLPHPPGGWLAAYAPFVAQVELETAARIATGIDSPWLVPVRSWCPVVHAEPPPAERPSEPLSPREAAICLVQLCDVLSRAHAGGWAGLEVDAHNVRLVHEADGWRIAVVLPHLPPRGKFPRSFERGKPSVGADLRTAVGLFVDLVTGTDPGGLDPWRTGWSWNTELPVPEIGDPAVRSALQEVLSGDGGPVADAASLAALVLPLAPELATVVERMPRASEVRIRHDWDRLVALGEAELAGAPGDPFKTLPLAAAYHQRAVERLAAGDPEAAVRDLDRAVELDPGPKNLTTRAMARRAAGDPGATEDLDRAIADLRRFESDFWARWIWRGSGYEVNARDHGDLGVELVPWFPGLTEPRNPYDDGGWRLLPREESDDVARASYVRAVWRFEQRDLDGAAADLELAEALLPDPDALGAGGGTEGERLSRAVRQAAVPIRRAVARADGSARARWRLVQALAAVGRLDDARREAEQVLASPDGERFRKAYARLLRA